jgi:hypothetical protein
VRSPKRAPRGLTVSATAALIFTIVGFTPPLAAAEDTGPHMVVGLVTQEILGCGWPEAVPVTMTIQRPSMPAVSRTATSGGEIPESWLALSGECNVYFDVAAGPLVKAGDVVTMTDGTTTRSQLVPDLTVNLRHVASELSGTTSVPLPEGSVLSVRPDWWWNGGPVADVVPTPAGSWSVSFEGEWDLLASTGVVTRTDADGDQTVVTTPAPEVVTDPMSDRIWAMDFAKGDISLTITRSGGIVFQRTVATQNVISGGWRLRDMWVQPIGTLDRPTMALFDLKGLFDIQAGDVITASDAVTSRTITVDDLTIDSADAATDTVTGHATRDVAFNLNDGQGYWGYGTTPVNGQYSFFFNPNDFPNQGLEPGMTVIAIGSSWQTIVRHTIPIGYLFSGFFSPIDNRPTVNTAKAGRAIPVKFSLDGNFGLDIFAAGYPASKKIASTGGPTDAVEVTLNAGNSSLSYDSKTGVYTYIWKTDKAWAGTCRQLVLRLGDGTERVADFKF